MRHLILIFLAALGLAGIAAVAGVAGAETKPAPHSQEVDNATEGRFDAPEGWGASSYGKGVYDENYRFARPAEDGADARFRIEVPETADYAVYARWPEVKGLNASVPVGVETTSGLKWTRVNQQRDGGRWVRLGVFEMAEGDDYSVRFSRRTSGEGYVAADAVKAVRVRSDGSPSKPPRTRSGNAAAKKALEKNPESTGPSRKAGGEVVREARKWFGTPYRLGRASRSGIDCSGLTMQVYRRFGISLPHSDDAQYRYGKKVSGSLRPGDLVFFNEYGDGISHEGIYAGNGKVLHASDYFGRVTESEIKYIKGYVGARRLL